MFLRVSKKYSTSQEDITLIPLKNITGRGFVFTNSDGTASVELLYYADDEIKSLQIVARLGSLLECSLFIDSFVNVLEEKIEQDDEDFDVDEFIESFIKENENNPFLNFLSKNAQGDNK